MSTIKSHKLTFPSPVSSLAAHPTKPILTAGCISGHVYSYTWDDDGYKVLWKTRRHKGSCRCVAYSDDGETIYTAATDSLIKLASTTTGVVTQKLLLPSSTTTSGADNDNPTVLHPLNPHSLLLGTDNGHVLIYDTRSSTPSPSTTFSNVHSSYISSISPLPPTSESTSGYAKQFITTGDTTLSALDVRKGVLSKSDDQEDDITSSTIISGVGKNGRSTRAYVGLAGGVIHAFERGVWGDMVERIKIGSGVDVVSDITPAMTALGYGRDGKKSLASGEGRYLGVGCEDGAVRVVVLGRNQVVKEFRHEQNEGGGEKTAGKNKKKKKVGEEEEEEGITAVVVDCDGAMVTAAGESVRAWYEEGGEDDGSDSDDSDDDSDEEKKKVEEAPVVEDSDDSDSDSDSDSDKGEKKKRRKKRKKSQNAAKAQPAKKRQTFSGLD